MLRHDNTFFTVSAANALTAKSMTINKDNSFFISDLLFFIG